MNAATVQNGRPQRKQLSDQLDRLDGIIDALADGLNKAVADAAREGSREAVKEILTEPLTNPDILTMIRSTVGSMIPPPASRRTAARGAARDIPSGTLGRDRERCGRHRREDGGCEGGRGLGCGQGRRSGGPAEPATEEDRSDRSRHWHRDRGDRGHQPPWPRP